MIALPVLRRPVFMLKQQLPHALKILVTDSSD